MTAIANRQRGEVSIKGPEDTEYKLCLTLGAIAQIEEGLGIESLTEIETVMKKTRMRDVLTIFIALLHGGGHTDITQKDMIRWDVDLPEVMDAIARCFAAAGFGDEKKDGAGEESGK
jgi:hypothetical protein